MPPNIIHDGGAGDTPPHFEDADKSLAASWMLDRSTIDGSRVPLNYFYLGPVRGVAGAVLALHDADIEPDVVTVAERLDRDGKLEQVGGTAFLLELLRTVPHAQHAKYYAGIVRDKAALREFDEVRDITADARKPGADPGELWQRIDQLRERSFAHRPRSWVTLAAELRDYDPANEPAPRFFNFGDGFQNVDAGPGMMLAIAAAPGDGKTALVMQWGTDAMRLDPTLRVLVCNVEMTRRQLIDRQLARLSGINLSTIRNRRLMLHHGPRLDSGLSVLREIGDRLAFCGPPFTTDAIDTAVRQHKPDLIIVDYIQRVRPPGEHADTRTRINAVVDRCRHYAHDGAGVILVSAVSRQKGSNGSNYSGLGLASFRESSELEYGVDSAFLMEPDKDDPTRLRLINPKHRDGEKRDIVVTFDGAHQQFTVEPEAYPVFAGDRA